LFCLVNSDRDFNERVSDNLFYYVNKEHVHSLIEIVGECVNEYFSNDLKDKLLKKDGELRKSAINELKKIIDAKVMKQ
ncbi:hypothetical protein, partial [Vibrio parahaemolyticus]